MHQKPDVDVCVCRSILIPFFDDCVSGSCCLQVWTAEGSWETSSSPTDMQSSCDQKPNTAPSAPFCAAWRASGRGVRLQTRYNDSEIQYNNSDTVHIFLQQLFHQYHNQPNNHSADKTFSF